MQRMFVFLFASWLLPLACTHPMPAKKSSGGDAGAGGLDEGSTGSGGIAGASAGAVATGGQGPTETGSSGTSPVGCADTSICFRNGQGEGMFTGLGWVDRDQPSSFLTPTCGDQPIEAYPHCTSPIRWNKSDALCMSGEIPLANPRGQFDQWGMMVGVNAREPNDAVGPKAADFKSVTFTFSGDPKTGIRVVIHRKGDSESETYCVDGVASGKVMTLTKFNTKCWGDPDAVKLTPEDLPNIDQIGLLVNASYDSRLVVTDFCLERIDFGK